MNFIIELDLMFTEGTTFKFLDLTVYEISPPQSVTFFYWLVRLNYVWVQLNCFCELL